MRSAGVVAGAGLGKSLLKGFIAIGVITKITGFVSDAFDEAREAQKVGALTDAVIKSTGGVANVTAAQVDRLSTALSVKTGVDDEAIASGANLLLTFTNVRNEAGKGNDIFNQATRTVQDMAAAFGGDAVSNSKLLGKALNDPVKGVSALTRVGVSFTAAQKEQIETLVESGNVLGAQKLILGELTKETGGAAEATATFGARASVAFDNIKEQVGTALLPALDGLAKVFVTKIAPALSTFITNLQNGSGRAGAFGNFIRNDLVPALQEFYAFVVAKVVPAVRDALQDALRNAKAGFAQVQKAVRDNRPELEQLFRAFKKVAAFVLSQLMPAMIKLQAKALPLLGFAIRAIITAAGFWVNAFNKAKSVTQTLASVVSGAVNAFRILYQGAKDVVGKMVSFIKDKFGKVGSAAGIMKSAVVRVFTAISSAIQGAIDKVETLIDKLNSLKSKGGGATKNTPYQGTGKVGEEAGRLLAEGLARGAKGGIPGVDDAMEKLTKKVKDHLKSLREKLASVRDDFASLVEPIASNFTQGLFDFDTASAFTANLSTVKGTLTTLMANFKTLIGEGLAPGFLYQLFQSGGPALINSLAGLDKASALAAGGLFSDVMSLSDQLGTAVAGSTDKGAALEAQTQRLEKKLDKLIHAVHNSADRTADAVTQPSKRARRRAVRAA